MLKKEKSIFNNLLCNINNKDDKLVVESYSINQMQDWIRVFFKNKCKVRFKKE